MSSKNSSTSGVSLEEFLNIIRKKKEVQLYHNEIRHIFTAFDIHYRGFLTLEDFQRAFRLVAPKLPERTVLEVFRLLLSIAIAGPQAYQVELQKSLGMSLRTQNFKKHVLPRK
uniref:EF-hand calcium-binding domain-containing protein 11 isoform X3 n=1 Tax=Ictidomys tridecemlineatus TaxID=43179 RepID=UPI001A9CDD56|nr:EF-hand calcium-binding domain-containing protein 11 isoform X3 [Ictidomys tridecemlineatus]